MRLKLGKLQFNLFLEPLCYIQSDIIFNSNFVALDRNSSGFTGGGGEGGLMREFTNK